MEDKFKIIVYQQNGSGASKIKGINDFAPGRFEIETIDIDEPLPQVIDDAHEILERYKPSMEAPDLVIDHMKHPDISYELAIMYGNKNIQVVASGKKAKVANLVVPPTCCGLPRNAATGLYGELFGAPAFEVVVDDGKISDVTVTRGAPCGASWHAAKKIIGLNIEDAPVKVGLVIQFNCYADPSNWDPFYGKSPVHFAGDIHRNALEKAIKDVS